MLRNGMQMKIDEVNAAGGIHGRKIHLGPAHHHAWPAHLTAAHRVGNHRRAQQQRRHSHDPHSRRLACKFHRLLHLVGVDPSGPDTSETAQGAVSVAAFATNPRAGQIPLHFQAH